MTDLKVYLIGFIGTQDFRTVRAKSIKEAKNLFAQHNGIQVSSYIVAHKWTAENWNKCLSDNRMNGAYEDTIIKSLLRYSVSQEYDKAKEEWLFDGEVIDHGPIQDQMVKAHCSLCGHQIRYEYVITNKENKKRLCVGSECIGNYGIVHPAKIEGSLKRLKEAQYKKVSDAYQKASWTVHNLKASIRQKIEEKDGLLAWSNPLNKESKKDYETLNLNNEVIVYKILQSGIVHEIAKKHGHQLRQDYIDEFIAMFPGAKKDKAGFLKR